MIRKSLLSVFVILGFVAAAAPVAKAEPLPFPVIGPSSFVNDFYYARGNQRHNAIDIMADKGQKLVARVSGVITRVNYPQPYWGYSVFIKSGNREYQYLHMNDDTPGTNDGAGGGYFAYAPDIEEGKRVVKGQLLGWVGDSGLSNGVPHLHFEVTDGDGTPVNPYDGLKNNSFYLKKPADSYPQDPDEILPNGIGTGFIGGGSLALGDVDGDSVDEIIVGPGNGGTFLKIFEQNGTFVTKFEPFGSNYDGGVDVATGDTDNDGKDEIIVGSGPGGSYVKVFQLDGSLQPQTLLRFTPFGTSFTGGANVATGNLDGDPNAEIIAGAGVGGSYVKAFDNDGSTMSRFAPYGTTYKWGVHVAAGDTTGSVVDEIITGTRRNGSPIVSIFAPDGTQLDTFAAYHSDFKGGVKVSSADFRDDLVKDEIITVSQKGGTPRTKLFSGNQNHSEFSDFFAEEWWIGSYELAASDDSVMALLGVQRRTSVRPVEGLEEDSP